MVMTASSLKMKLHRLRAGEESCLESLHGRKAESFQIKGDQLDEQSRAG
jgi:hypothetical protein